MVRISFGHVRRRVATFYRPFFLAFGRDRCPVIRNVPGRLNRCLRESFLAQRPSNLPGPVFSHFFSSEKGVLSRSAKSWEYGLRRVTIKTDPTRRRQAD